MAMGTTFSRHSRSRRGERRQRGRQLASSLPAEGVEVVVGPGKRQFDILRIAASDAANYDMETEDLIKVLEKWDRLYGIDIVAAETDTIQLTLNR